MRYDEEYADILSQLKESFGGGRATEDTILGRKGLLLNRNRVNWANMMKQQSKSALTDQDIYELRIRCNGEIEKLELLNKEERELLEQIRAGEKQGFKQILWEIEGTPDPKQMIANFEELVSRIPNLRTNFMYRGLSQPVKVVYKAREASIKIGDIRNLDEKQQVLLVGNVMAAEARRKYNPQTDAVVKLQVFLVKGNQMLALLSIYPHITISMGSRGIIFKVFDGMKIQSSNMASLNTEKVELMNQKLKQSCHDYWKKELLPIGDSLRLPGMGKRRSIQCESCSVYKTIDKALEERLEQYSKEQNISRKALILMTWAEFFGRYYGNREPVLALKEAGECLNVFPVKIRRKLSRQERAADLKRQMENMTQYSACDFEELCDGLGIENDYFQMVHHFIEFHESDGIAGIADTAKNITSISVDDMDVALTMNYHVFGEETGINYIYRADCIYDVTIEKIHATFLQLLEEQLSAEKKEFNLREYIELTDSEEERIKKVQTARKALYIVQSGLFLNRTVEELMQLAERTRLQSYTMSDVVIEEQQAVCSVAFLAEGNIEESRTGTDGISKSVSVRQAGEVFGMEALLEDNISRFSYTVIGNEAKILWIDREDLTAFLDARPENWRALLERVHDEANRMKVLWTIV